MNYSARYFYPYRAGPENLIEALKQLGQGKIMDTQAGKEVDKPVMRKLINFRDYIMGPALVAHTDVLVNREDFLMLAEHYSFFIGIQSKMKSRIQDERKAVSAANEKLAVEFSYTQQNAMDYVVYGSLSLSYPQWKQRGRYVKHGEKSKISTVDGTGISYALFSFDQTDVAENRYKTIKPRCENNQTCTCINVCEDKRQ